VNLSLFHMFTKFTKFTLEAGSSFMFRVSKVLAALRQWDIAATFTMFTESLDPAAYKQSGKAQRSPKAIVSYELSAVSKTGLVVKDRIPLPACRMDRPAPPCGTGCIACVTSP
jgi:hypothetical protein